MPAWLTASSSTETRADGTRSSPSGPCGTSSGSRPAVEAVPRIGTGRVCGTVAGMAPQADPGHDAELPGQPHHVGLQLAPQVIRLGPGQHQQVPLADARGDQAQLGPVEVHELAVDDLQGRPAGAVVVDPIGVEGGDRPPALGQLVGRERAGAATVDPAVEGGDHDGGVEAGRGVEVIQGHRPNSIGRQAARRIPAGLVARRLGGLGFLGRFVLVVMRLLATVARPSSPP